MPRNKKPKDDEWGPSHADDARQRALDIVQQIRVSLEELEPLLTEGALDEEEQEKDAG